MIKCCERSPCVSCVERTLPAGLRGPALPLRKMVYGLPSSALQSTHISTPNSVRLSTQASAKPLQDRSAKHQDSPTPSHFSLHLPSQSKGPKTKKDQREAALPPKKEQKPTTPKAHPNSNLYRLPYSVLRLHPSSKRKPSQLLLVMPSTRLCRKAAARLLPCHPTCPTRGARPSREAGLSPEVGRTKHLDRSSMSPHVQAHPPLRTRNHRSKGPFTTKPSRPGRSSARS